MALYFVSAGQVDWAALAQAWIAQKESTGPEQQSIQPNGQDIPGIESAGQSNHGAFQGDPAFGRVWQPGAHLTPQNNSNYFFSPNSFLVYLSHCIMHSFVTLQVLML